jgi:PAS domain S-box-containing protein
MPGQQDLDEPLLAIWETDATGLVTAESASWRETTGQTVAESVGEGWAMAVHPDERDGALQHWRAHVQAGTPMMIDARMQRAGGGWEWTQLRASPVRSDDGSIRGWIAASIDLSRRQVRREREQATADALRIVHEKLERSEALLAGVFEATPIGIGVMDRAGALVLSNERLRHYLPTGMIPSRDPAGVTRWTAHDPAGRRLEPDHFPSARALRGDKVVPGIEMAYERDDGTTEWVHVAAVPMRDREGTVTGAFVVMSDIDALKRTELRLEALLEERETLRKELHHRVKNNLGVVDSLLQLQADSIENADARAALHAASSRIHAIAEAHRMLYQSRELAWVDLASYTRALSQAVFDSTVGDRDRITLTIETADVQLDLRRAVPFGLLLNEALTNTLKHAFPADQRGEVRIALRAEGDMIELVIADNGIGIREEAAPSGLGLKLVNVLAEQLHATVAFERDRGTTVRLRLPRD